MFDRLAQVADAAVKIASQRHKTPIAADVSRLSGLFTSERGSRDRNYMRDPALRRAYLGFFVPHNVARIALLLSRTQGDGLLPQQDAPRVVDVGAGPLSGILACWAFYGRLGHCVAVDLSKAALEDGQEILAAVGADVASLELIDRSITAPPTSWLPPPGTVDVVIAANVLNEIGDPREPAGRLRIVDACVQSLAPRGRVLVVEPSLRVEARSLMTVRDAVVEAGVAAVLSPCRGAEACPLLRTRGDWCHGEMVWERRPPAYRVLEEAVRLPKDLLSASHLLLGPTDETSPNTGLRLVGGVMRAADRDRRYACGRDLVTLEGTPRLLLAAAQPLRGSLVGDDIAPRATVDPRRQAREETTKTATTTTTTKTSSTVTTTSPKPVKTAKAPADPTSRSAGAGPGRGSPRPRSEARKTKPKGAPPRPSPPRPGPAR